MKAPEAETIISGYRKVLSLGPIGGTTLRKLSWLPYSKGTIKYAYFSYLDDQVSRGLKIDELQKDELMREYTSLAYFVADKTAEKYSAIYDQWQKKKKDVATKAKEDRGIKQYLVYIHTLGSSDLSAEIAEFIEDLKKRN